MKTKPNDLIKREDVMAALGEVFDEYGISWGMPCGGFASAVSNAIKNIPTAYDPNKIVERLKERYGQSEQGYELNHFDTYYRGKCEAFDEAIEIVKGGAE